MLAKALQSAAKSVEPVFIEDTFAVHLYTGNGSTQTITNGIDLSGKGGLVWSKCRSNGGAGTNEIHTLIDTIRGAGYRLSSEDTGAQVYNSNTITAFNSTGFAIGNSPINNTNSYTYVSWAFREQAKFFDVVTYTGNGGTKTVNHNLGSTPGCIITKRTDSTGDWIVWHRTQTDQGVLNSTSAFNRSSRIGTVTSTSFNAIDAVDTNVNGATYVAYLFAHDAGGFGASGSDNVISCGSFTTDGSGLATVTLGYEPQWVLYKRSSGTEGWNIIDNMRGFAVTGGKGLAPDSSTAEYDIGSSTYPFKPTAIGFESVGAVSASSTYIYIAIRRGPMKTPTTGTSVFSPVVYTGTNADNRLVDMSLLTDMVFVRQRDDTVLGGMVVGDRLRGDPYLLTGTTAAEVSDADSFMTPTSGVGNSWSAMNGFGVGNDATSKLNASTTSNNQIAEGFRRAPGFFDEVCYTGDGTGGSGRAITHNLGVAPELVIVKSRSNTYAWRVWQTSFGTTYNALLNTNAAQNTDFYLWANTYLAVTTPATQFGVYGDGTTNSTNTNAATYVAYLFATCPGVSKVGSYTGTGNTLQIDCGFTGGARFVLVKRTDSTGDWYVWDSARGIVSGNDPYLLLNSTAAEVTTTDWVDTYSAGFELSNAGGNNANINTATYIFLAVA